MNPHIINTAKETEADLLAVITKRQSQHIEFFKTLEDIRWKFTSALGVAALSALFVVSPSDVSLGRAAIGIMLVVALSIAAIVTQIRIYSLIVVIWTRILTLQHAESRILKKHHELDEQTQQAFFFPRIGVLNSGGLHLLTVGMVSCLVFSLIIGIAALLAAHKLAQSHLVSVAIGVGVTLFFSAFSLLGSKLYIRALQSTGDSFTLSK